ncbi:lanthionine synthetase C family protein [Kitasatospora sp. NPDC098663]|uniref:lanthionine synthetase C family protein n=1 Tax=Kitasatospora sp. NPDC098663 TaxID=3364096 RepID=UPI003804F6AC
MTPDQALDIADALASPAALTLPAREQWWRQSLAHGAPGITLLHAELAAAGLRPFDRVHSWLTAAASGPVTTGTDTGLWYGAPAIAFTMTAATAAHPGAYRGARKALDEAVAADALRRAQVGRARIACGQPPELAEFDAIRGLSGLGAHLLHSDPGGEALREVLHYLVQLAQPLPGDGGRPVPGWWTLSGSNGRPDPNMPSGHANFGLAHGICGPLALASLAALHGVTVPGQLDAIATWCRWLDRWRIDTEAGARWPYVITRAELDEPPADPAEITHSGAARRPSWCYGTAGLARAQQLAALATGDRARQHLAEHALLGALADPGQRATVRDSSLCHGFTGLAHIAHLAAADADEANAGPLRRLATALLHQATAADDGPGLLEGRAGTALAALAPLTGKAATGWDTRFLIA